MNIYYNIQLMFLYACIRLWIEDSQDSLPKKRKPSPTCYSPSRHTWRLLSEPRLKALLTSGLNSLNWFKCSWTACIDAATAQIQTCHNFDISTGNNNKQALMRPSYKKSQLSQIYSNVTSIYIKIMYVWGFLRVSGDSEGCREVW